jgi:hypothetical protein
MRLSDFLARAWKLANDKARELGLVNSASADGRATFAGNYNQQAKRTLRVRGWAAASLRKSPAM